MTHGRLARQVLASYTQDKAAQKWTKDLGLDYISDLAWFDFDEKPADLPEIAENHEVFPFRAAASATLLREKAGTQQVCERYTVHIR